MTTYWRFGECYWVFRGQGRYESFSHALAIFPDFNGHEMAGIFSDILRLFRFFSGSKISVLMAGFRDSKWIQNGFINLNHIDCGVAVSRPLEANTGA